MKAVILQPSYIPWRGYFHQVALADVFVFYDDVQYDKHGWRNRNRIKTHQGTRWLSIPAHGRGAPADRTPVNGVRIDWSTGWSRKHWLSLQQSYARAPYFDRYAPLLEHFYARRDELLADFTIDLTVALAHEMGIERTRFVRSSQIPAQGTQTRRLVAILQHIGADHYISGPSARDYIQPELFSQAGIALEYMEYHYPEYPQLYPPYDPQVSILDLLFMVGERAMEYILGESEDEGR